MVAGVNMQEVPMSATYSWTDQNQINAANAQNVTDMQRIEQMMQGAVTQGLSLYNSAASTAGLQGVADQAAGMIGPNTYSPGSVDLSNYQPYMQNGALASNQLAAMQGLGANPMSAQQIENQYLNTAAVQAQMNAGNNQINNNYSTRGGLGSGAMMRALQSYGQGIAAQTIGSAQDRLAAQAGLGATTANQYAASLLNKYNIDQTAQTAYNQNQLGLLNAQTNAYGQQAQNASAQTGFLSSLANNNAQLQAQAAANRQSALVNSASKTTQQNQWTAGIMGGTIGAANSSLNVRG